VDAEVTEDQVPTMVEEVVAGTQEAEELHIMVKGTAAVATVGMTGASTVVVTEKVITNQMVDITVTVDGAVMTPDQETTGAAQTVTPLQGTIELPGGTHLILERLLLRRTSKTQFLSATSRHG